MDEDLPHVIKVCNRIHNGRVQYTKVRAYGREDKLLEYAYQRYAWGLHREEIHTTLL